MKSVKIQISIWFLFVVYMTQVIAGGSNPFNDEFHESVDLLVNNTSQWQVLGFGMMDERAEVIEMTNGLLIIEPEIFEFNAWFEDEYGPLVYQLVSGNFAVVIQLRVVKPGHIDEVPDLGFNAGGFVIRDPVGTHQGDENWVMYNMGGQGQDGVTYAREMKKTVDSTSNLFLTEQVGLEEYLLACRVGDLFYFYYWADAINGWRQETFYNQYQVDGILTTTWQNSDSVTPEIIPSAIGEANPMYFEHTGMPETVQVGIMAHSWTNGIDGVLGSFNFIRFADSPPQNQSQCTSAFEQLGNDLIFIDGFNLGG